jgi:hypothetical protein
VTGTSVLFEPDAEDFLPPLPGGDIDREPFHVIRGSPEMPRVEFKEDSGSRGPDASVALDEGMAEPQRLEERGGFVEAEKLRHAAGAGLLDLHLTADEVSGDDERDVLQAMFQEVGGDGIERLRSLCREFVTDDRGELVDTWAARETFHSWSLNRFIPR